MEIKYTILGLLIYVAILGYFSAFVTTFFDRRKVSGILFTIGFAAALAAKEKRVVQMDRA